MYRIYEVINSDKNIRESKWTTKDTIRRFTQTANHPKSSGKDSRHGVNNERPHGSPMSLDKAKEFIDDIFSKWINDKKEHYAKELT